MSLTSTPSSRAQRPRVLVQDRDEDGISSIAFSAAPIEGGGSAVE